MDRKQLLARIDRAWSAFTLSYDGLDADVANEPGAVGDWSVKDIVAHVTTWEEETLKNLPLIMKGLRTSRYGDIDRFNAEHVAKNRHLALSEVLQQLSETHRRLIAFLEVVPESQFATETHFRRRLRLDTYGHYPDHTASIWMWRRT